MTNNADNAPSQKPKVEQNDKTARKNQRGYLLLILAFFALSLNLRAPLTSLPPIIQDIRNLFDIGGGFAGFLTSIPVLCFGLLTPLIGYLMKHLRLETSIFLTLLGIALGSILRAEGTIGGVVFGTVIIGIALTAGNIAGLLVIGREFPNRINAMTGLYVSGMSCGSMGTMALTAPISHTLGWRIALASPALLAFAAIALWIAAILRKQKNEAPQAAEKKKQRNSASPSVLKQPLVWILSAAFAAHTFLFYGITAWLPVYLEQTLQMSDATAGMVASLFQLMGLLGCFGIPLLAGTQRLSNNGLFLVVTISWTATVMGFWFAPNLWFPWIICGGIGSGGGFTVIFSLIMHRAKDLNENRAMSTVVQSAGYIVASFSPFAIGYLHELAHNWQGSMALLTVAAVLMILCGLAANRQST